MSKITEAAIAEMTERNEGWLARAKDLIAWDIDGAYESDRARQTKRIERDAREYRIAMYARNK